MLCKASVCSIPKPPIFLFGGLCLHTYRVVPWDEATTVRKPCDANHDVLSSAAAGDLDEDHHHHPVRLRLIGSAQTHSLGAKQASKQTKRSRRTQPTE